MERKGIYIPVKKVSLFYRHFLYFDREPYMADHLFVQHNVRIKFGPECRKEGSPYVGIFCRVKKRDVPAFQAAMADLERGMAVCGYDYQKDLAQVFEDFERIL